jgi:hypothetical protein
MKITEWKTYRTRFLVKAKQLNSSLSFTDHLGRQHCGRKGDYLVESCDGVLSIAPRQIFEDIYVAMTGTPSLDSPNGTGDSSSLPDHSGLSAIRVEALKIEKIRPGFGDDCRRSVISDRSTRLHRKSPQPVRVTASRLSLM